MEQVARSYLIYDITDSAVMLGAINLSGAIPILVLSLFGGAVADRFPKKTLIQLSQIGMTIVFLCYGVAVSIGYLTKDHPESWWVLWPGQAARRCAPAFGRRHRVWRAGSIRHSPPIDHRIQP